MCLTIPAQVIQYQNNKALVWQYDRVLEVDTSILPDIKEGDWILYISDVAIKKIDKDDAAEINELLVSKPPIRTELLNPGFAQIVKNSQTRQLSKEEIVFLLNTEGLEKEALFREAEIARKTHIRDFICVHGIIEFSNYCRNNCMYCGLRKDNRYINRYRMETEEIIETSVDSVNDRGYKLLVLQSGEDIYYTPEMLADIVKDIKSRCRVFIFLSIGDRDYAAYKLLREAGASGVLYRFETSNPELFGRIHNKDYGRRFEHLRFMKELKYFIASGPLIGLPGQTTDDLAEDLLTVQKLRINMVSMGPFIPCSNTPYTGEEPGDLNMCLKMISVARLMMKKARIPVATAIETVDRVNGRRYAMRAGANALMFNLTPERYHKDYTIYPDRFIEQNSMLEKYALFNNDGSYRMLEQRLTSGII